MKTTKIFLSLLVMALSIPTLLMGQENNRAIFVKKPGTLISELTLAEAKNITHLTLTGKINAVDFKNLRDDFTNIEVLDISAVEIRNYVGKKGTLDQFHVYTANTIPSHAFSEQTDYNPKPRTALQKVILPLGLKSIEKFAFANCPNLEVLVFTSGEAPSLTENALSAQRTAIFVPAGCKENYTQKKAWENYAVIDSEPVRARITLGKQDDLADALIKQGIQPKNVNFLTLLGHVDADDLKIIRDYMANLVYIDMRKADTTEIPEYTFAQKTSLLTAYLPDNLKSIGLRAFDNCNKLGPTLLLPASLTSIGYGAFINCSSLDVVQALGNKITAIGENVFGEGIENKLVYSK